MAVVIQITGFANGAYCPIAGQYLQDFDFDANDGRGFGVFTDDIHAAMLFKDFAEATCFGRTVSAVRPVRSDGMPNRPLSCSHAVFVWV